MGCLGSPQEFHAHLRAEKVSATGALRGGVARFSCDSPPNSRKCNVTECSATVRLVQGPLNGGVSNGGVSRSGLVLPFLSFFVLFCPFFSFFVLFLSFPDFSGIFPICSGMVRGFSRFVTFLFLGLLRAPTRTVPKGSAKQSGPFLKKVGNTRVWKHPGLASLN